MRNRIGVAFVATLVLAACDSGGGGGTGGATTSTTGQGGSGGAGGATTTTTTGQGGSGGVGGVGGSGGSGGIGGAGGSGGAGGAVQCTPQDAAVSCDDQNPCTDEGCSNGTCTNTPVAPGTPCGNGTSCNALGACVGPPPGSAQSTFAAPSSSDVLRLAYDAAGNLYVAGSFPGPTLQLGPIKLGPVQGPTGAFFVAKLDAALAVVWQKAFSSSDYQALQGVAVDAAGNVTLGGMFNGTLGFGGAPLVEKSPSFAGSALFFARLDSAGNHLWSKAYGPPSNLLGGLAQLVGDAAGNIAFTGAYQNNIDFGLGSFAQSWYGVRMSAAGGVTFALDLASTALLPIGFAPAGELVALGSCNFAAGTPSVGGMVMPCNSNGDAFFVRLDAAGKPTWSKAIPLNGQATFQAAALGPGGSIYLWESLKNGGPVDFGGGPVSAPGSAPRVLVAYDASGSYLFAKTFPNTSNLVPKSFAVDPQGRIFVTGALKGPVDFGAGPLPYSGGDDVFAAKLDPTGDVIWARAAGDAANQGAVTLALGPSGELAVGGGFKGTMNLGAGPVSCGAAQCGYFAKLHDAAICTAQDAAITCNDANPCTVEGCDGNGACTHAPAAQGTSCGAGVVCDGAGVCLAPQCTPQNAAITCDDQNPCTIESCAAGACAHAPAPAGSACAGGQCNAGGLCVIPPAPWGQRVGDGNDQQGIAAAVDAAGNTFVVGHFKGSTNFGGGPVWAADGRDVLLVKIDPTGKLLWGKAFGGAGDDLGQAVAVDAAGNVVLTGRFAAQIDFGGGPRVSAGGSDAFVAKLDPNGAHLWSRRYGDANDQEGTAIAVSAAGDVYAAGDFFGSIDLGNGALSANGAPPNVRASYLARLDAAGSAAWSKAFAITPGSGNGTAHVGSIALDPSGAIVLGGQASGSVELGGAPVKGGAGGSPFLAKLTTAGAHVWSKGFPVDAATVDGLAIDGAGNVAITGQMSGTIDFGGGPLTTSPDPIDNPDAYAAAFSAAGQHLWSKQLSGKYGQYGRGAAFDAAGDALVCGQLVGNAGGEVFVIKYGPAGQQLSSKQFIGSVGVCNDIAVSASGRVILAGTLSGAAVDFGSGPLPPKGSGDLFAADVLP